MRLQDVAADGPTSLAVTILLALGGILITLDQFRWAEIIFGLALLPPILWLWFRPYQPGFEAFVFIIMLVAFGGLVYGTEEYRDKRYPPPSLVYVVPAVWSPTPTPEWIMIVRHCGPSSLYNVTIGFTDEDRSEQIRRRGNTTPEEIAQTYTDLGPFSEIDPTSHGARFFWAPLNPDDENYSVRVTSRDGIFDETLKVARRSGEWLNSIKVSEINDGIERIIINCRDKRFADSEDDLPACFPHYISAPHQGTC